MRRRQMLTAIGGAGMLAVIRTPTPSSSVGLYTEESDVRFDSVRLRG